MSDTESPTTEPCGQVLQVIHCDLPRGHGGDEHHAEVALPPAVNMMLADAMNRADAMHQHYRKARDFMYLAGGAWLVGGASFVYLILTR